MTQLFTIIAQKSKPLWLRKRVSRHRYCRSLNWRAQDKNQQIVCLTGSPIKSSLVYSYAGNWRFCLQIFWNKFSNNDEIFIPKLNLDILNDITISLNDYTVLKSLLTTSNSCSCTVEINISQCRCYFCERFVYIFLTYCWQINHLLVVLKANSIVTLMSSVVKNHTRV